MLYRNAPFVLFSVLLFLIYIIYSADDEPPAGQTPASQASGAKSRALPAPGRPGRPVAAARHSARVPATIRPNPLLAGGSRNKTRLKTILYWNEFYGRYDTYDFGYGHEAFVEKQCPHSNCFATKDRTLIPLEEYDAIIIHIRGLPNDWPKVRSAKQRYIMLSIEAPIQLQEYRHLDQLLFNWTMTYRLDSDFPIPYAWIDQLKPLPAPAGSTLLERYIAQFGRRAVEHGPNLADDKVGLAVQFVSNCHSASRREVYVRELQKYVSVDVYGKCGQFECAKDKGWDCYRMAESKYKFYLSFEDAVCKDYATEKFFTMYSLRMIPVVLGGANYSGIAPPHSFIDAAEFPSAKALAHHLKLLDQDDAKFNEYFWWKDFYARQFHHHRTLCDVCERLHTQDGQHKAYDDMHEWWVDQSQCRTLKFDQFDAASLVPIA